MIHDGGLCGVTITAAEISSLTSTSNVLTTRDACRTRETNLSHNSIAATTSQDKTNDCDVKKHLSFILRAFFVAKRCY